METSTLKRRSCAKWYKSGVQYDFRTTVQKTSQLWKNIQWKIHMRKREAANRRRIEMSVIKWKQLMEREITGQNHLCYNRQKGFNGGSIVKIKIYSKLIIQISYNHTIYSQTQCRPRSDDTKGSLREPPSNIHNKFRRRFRTAQHFVPFLAP